MKSHKETLTNKVPLFDGTSFSFWNIIMRTYRMSLGADFWDVVDTGYVNPVVLASKHDNL